METIEGSAYSNTAVHGSNMQWNNWKTALSSVFKITSTLTIIKNHVFQFNYDFHGRLNAQELTNTVHTKFNLLNNGVSFTESHEIIKQLVNSSENILQITDLA